RRLPFAPIGCSACLAAAASSYESRQPAPPSTARWRLGHCRKRKEVRRYEKYAPPAANGCSACGVGR
ncbi:unnamed protein product, partial [Urochloa humidicola]